MLYHKINEKDEGENGSASYTFNFVILRLNIFTSIFIYTVYEFSQQNQNQYILGLKVTKQENYFIIFFLTIFDYLR